MLKKLVCVMCILESKVKTDIIVNTANFKTAKMLFRTDRSQDNRKYEIITIIM